MIREVILSWLPVVAAIVLSVITSRGSTIVCNLIKRDTKNDYKKLYDKVDNQGYQIKLLQEENSVLKKQNQEIIDKLENISLNIADKVQIEAKNSNDLSQILQSTVKAINDINTVKAQNKALLKDKE